MAVNVDTRRRLNEHRRQLFRAAEREIAFLCECEDDDCTRSVLLTPFAYDEVREREDQLLHPGHHEAAA